MPISGWNGLKPNFIQILNKLFWLTVRTPPADYDNALIRDTNARVIGYYEKLEGAIVRARLCRWSTIDDGRFPNPGRPSAVTSELPIERPERPELPNVAAWYRRLSERDAHRRHVMVSFEERRGWLAH